MNSTSERADPRAADGASGRILARADFLRRAGLAGARVAPMAGDASTRAYARLHREGAAPLILMDAPPAAEPGIAGPGATPDERRALGYNALARLAAGRTDAFAAVAAHLAAAGLSAPRVHALDVEAGFAVLEDLGQGLFATRLAAGEAATPLYAAAIDLLAGLHAAPPPRTLAFAVGEAVGAWPLLDYDALALRTGVDLFPQWWPAFARRPAFGEAALGGWEAAWAPVVARVAAGARVFTHRDFHAENLIWLPARRGAARVGLLDFQDAVRGHAAWDLASLLQDARRDVDPALEAAMLARYLAAAEVTDAPALREDYAAVAALNALRIVGVFSRLIVRDAKPRYAGFMDRMWGYLARDLAHPGLQAVRAWFARHAPDAPLQQA